MIGELFAIVAGFSTFVIGVNLIRGRKIDENLYMATVLLYLTAIYLK